MIKIYQDFCVVLIFVTIGSLAWGGTTHNFLQVKYHGNPVKVYGYLNDDAICIENDNQYPGIIKISELDSCDAAMVAERFRSSGFENDDFLAKEAARAFVLSNTASRAVSYQLRRKYKNYCVVDCSLTCSTHMRHILAVNDSLGVSAKIGEELPPMHHYFCGKILDVDRYSGKDGGCLRIEAFYTTALEDAVKLLSGWMCEHMHDEFVHNILNGMPVEYTPKQVPKRKTIPKAIIALEKFDVSDIIKKDFAKKVASWRRRNINTRSLQQYNSSWQVAWRLHLEDLVDLLSKFAVAYTDEINQSKLKECVDKVNWYYKFDGITSFWARPTLDNKRLFEQDVGQVLSVIDGVIKENGDRFGLAKKSESLYLQACCGVDTWEKLSAKIAVEKAIEEKQEEERLFWQEERRIQAEREKADAIRHQTHDVYLHW